LIVLFESVRRIRILIPQGMEDEWQTTKPNRPK
jgi:hypothetical protein